MQDWRLMGPRVSREWLESIVNGPGDLTIYHNEWVRRSGVLENSAVCHNHYTFCQILRALISVDQLDPTNSLAAESLIRKIVQDELAVSWNPKHPDYSGLDMFKLLATSSGQWLCRSSPSGSRKASPSSRTFTSRHGFGLRSNG